MNTNFTPGVIFERRFRLVRALGNGGFGAVYEAVDQNLNRPVAVKILHGRYQFDSVDARRLMREGQALSELICPNLVRLYSIGVTEDGQCYAIYELLHGKTLREHLAESAPLPESQVLQVGLQCARALETIAGAGFAHRDLKPDNIMVEDTDPFRLKVIDLGLLGIIDRSLTDPRLTPDGQIVGSVHYVAPEVCTGKKATVKTDMYALGCVLFECVTGSPPFTGETAVAVFTKHITQEAVFTPDSVARFSDDLLGIVSKLLRKNPADRYDSVSELIDDLEQVSNNNTASGASGLPTIAAVTAPSCGSSKRRLKLGAARRTPARRNLLLGGALFLSFSCAGLIAMQPQLEQNDSVMSLCAQMAEDSAAANGRSRSVSEQHRMDIVRKKLADALSKTSTLSEEQVASLCSLLRTLENRKCLDEEDSILCACLKARERIARQRGLLGERGYDPEHSLLIRAVTFYAAHNGCQHDTDGSLFNLIMSNVSSGPETALAGNERLFEDLRIQCLLSKRLDEVDRVSIVLLRLLEQRGESSRAASICRDMASKLEPFDKERAAFYRKGAVDLSAHSNVPEKFEDAIYYFMRANSKSREVKDIAYLRLAESSHFTDSLSVYQMTCLASEMSVCIGGNPVVLLKPLKPLAFSLLESMEKHEHDHLSPRVRADLIFAKGRLLRELGELPRALEAFETAWKIAPSEALALHYAVRLAETGSWTRACKFLPFVHSPSKSDAAYSYLQYCYNHKLKPPDHMEDYLDDHQANAVTFQNADFHHVRALRLALSGDHQAADLEYTRAVALLKELRSRNKSLVSTGPSPEVKLTRALTNRAENLITLGRAEESYALATEAYPLALSSHEQCLRSNAIRVQCMALAQLEIGRVNQLLSKLTPYDRNELLIQLSVVHIRKARQANAGKLFAREHEEYATTLSLLQRVPLSDLDPESTEQYYLSLGQYYLDQSVIMVTAGRPKPESVVVARKALDALNKGGNPAWIKLAKGLVRQLSQ